MRQNTFSWKTAKGDISGPSHSPCNIMPSIQTVGLSDPEDGLDSIKQVFTKHAIRCQGEYKHTISAHKPIILMPIHNFTNYGHWYNPQTDPKPKNYLAP